MSNFTPYFLTLSENQKRQAVEAIVFASDEPLGLDLLFEILFEKDEIDKEIIRSGKQDKPLAHKEFASLIFDKYSWSESHIKDILSSINKELEVENRAMRIVDFAGGFQFVTKEDHGKYIAKLYNRKANKKLSKAALEALAIIAYKQPISKPGIEEIRGINSNEVVNSLLEKNLIRIAGRSKTIGKSLLYATNDEFLKLFALNSLDDLPKLKEIEEISTKEETEDLDNQVEIELEEIDKSEEMDDN